MILHIALGIVLGFFLLRLIFWGWALVVLGFVEHPVITIMSMVLLLLFAAAWFAG
jgi:hypothetical protein